MNTKRLQCAKHMPDKVYTQHNMTQRKDLINRPPPTHHYHKPFNPFRVHTYTTTIEITKPIAQDMKSLLITDNNRIHCMKH